MSVNKIVQKELVFHAERVDKEQEYLAPNDLSLDGFHIVLAEADHVVGKIAELISKNFKSNISDIMSQ